MNIEALRDYCFSKSQVTESLPFDDSSLVFKVLDKIFLIVNLNPPFYFNAKCDPLKALRLREKYPFIQPGYHMNKQHWNSIYLDDCFNDTLLCELIDHSYDLVVSKMPKKQRELVS